MFQFRRVEDIYHQRGEEEAEQAGDGSGKEPLHPADVDGDVFGLVHLGYQAQRQRVRRHRGEKEVAGGFDDHVGVEQQVVACFARAGCGVGAKRDGNRVHDGEDDAARACGYRRHRRRDEQVKAGIDVTQTQGGAAEGADEQVGDALAEACGDEGGTHRKGSEDQPGGAGFVAVQHFAFFQRDFDHFVLFRV